MPEAPPPPNTYEAAPPMEEAAPARRAIREDEWAAFVKEVRDSDPLLASVLENVRILASEPGLLTLGVGNKFYPGQLSTGSFNERVRMLASQFVGGGSVRLAVEFTEVGETLASARKERIAAEEDARREHVRTHPVVEAAVRALEGKVIDIRVEEVRDDE